MTSKIQGVRKRKKSGKTRRSLSDGRNFKLHVLIFDIYFPSRPFHYERVRVAGMRAAHAYIYFIQRRRQHNGSACVFFKIIFMYVIDNDRARILKGERHEHKLLHHLVMINQARGRAVLLWLDRDVTLYH
jgi:hypothetical protein